MSDAFLRYVPIDPSFQPPESVANAAVVLLRSLAPAAEIVLARFADTIEFVDAGSNWDGVECSACGADAESWWGDAMADAAESGFESLDVTAGCCGATVSLNVLRYRWPVAFGRFVLEAMNPATPSLSRDALAKLGAVVGCELREIRAHL